MPTPLSQHQLEIQRNLQAWNRKPLLQTVYGRFYQNLRRHLNPALHGRTVEIGSGIGNLRQHFPDAIATDLFANPWVDLVCDGYDLPFRDESVAHLLMVDVFHHLEAPRAFLSEARRVLVPRGRVLLLDPFISWLSYPIYAWIHHEPVAWNHPIRTETTWPRPRRYYAAQGNATRTFFRPNPPAALSGWKLLAAHAFASFTYLASGGFSGPTFAPQSAQPWLLKLDHVCSRWPRLFGVRCLVCLEKQATETPRPPPGDPGPRA